MLAWMTVLWFSKRRAAPEGRSGRVGNAPKQVADRDYRCNVCIEEITKGDYMVRCACMQVFHVDCSKTVEICPKCGRNIHDRTAGPRQDICPKCGKPTMSGEWRWQCACAVRYHLECAKRLESCIKCSVSMDWADGKRVKVLMGSRLVMQMEGCVCFECGRAVTDAGERYECLCSALYHHRCIEHLGACRDCKGIPLFEGEGILKERPETRPEKG